MLKGIKPTRLKMDPSRTNTAARPTPRKLWDSMKTKITQPTVNASVVAPPIMLIDFRWFLRFFPGNLAGSFEFAHAAVGTFNFGFCLNYFCAAAVAAELQFHAGNEFDGFVASFWFRNC